MQGKLKYSPLVECFQGQDGILYYTARIVDERTHKLVAADTTNTYKTFQSAYSAARKIVWEHTN